MKSFNQLTESQMSKTEGGILATTIIGLCLVFASAVGFGGTISAAASKSGK